MPEGVQLPKSYYEAQKIMEDLGFTYMIIEACPNSCMLLKSDDISLNECSVCNASRWKEGNGGISNDGVEHVKPKAAKQTKYFPLKPRLQRLFMCSKTAKLMRWHAEERTDDEVFRHPADSFAWKDFDEKNTIFSEDIRNVRLGLALDGFNPFRSMNIVHSTWPVILVPYNLPPLMCMKQPFIFLYVLIDGPKAPGDKIDVYLQPLIEELKELFEDGVATFDSFNNEMFQMRVGLLWTINDFPAYANLSGWSTKGEFACPPCNSETGYQRLYFGVAGKTKDNLNSHRDLQLMGIRSRYHLKTNEAGVEYANPGDFEMNNKGKDLFFLGLLAARMPEEAASNIARHQLCFVDNCVADLEAARARIVLTLCELEKIFPPSFFDVMEHLPIHLADEALLTGYVIFRWMYPIERWMYPIERYLLTLKQYVRNRACPEASIANGYLMEECMNFCVQYLDDVQSKSNRRLRKKNDDDDPKKGKDIVLQETTRTQAHRWVLFHTEAVAPFLDEHLVTIRRQYPSADEHFVKSVHFREFATWFKEHVLSLQRRGVILSEEIVALSSFPVPSAKRFKSYKANGFLFRMKSIDNHRSTQNSGVTLLQADHSEESSPYYGKLTDIIKITYSIDIKYVLFKCDWVNPSTGIKFDRFKFPLVNFKCLLYKNDRIGDEPFIKFGML
ncbi:hypothetical protein ACLB2K_007562 [Fragaria x ananassa]